MICGDCIHKEVCGLEGYFDEALITCTHKTEIPHSTGYWKKISPADIYECSECGQNVMTQDICAYHYCHGCGAKMGGK